MFKYCVKGKDFQSLFLVMWRKYFTLVRIRVAFSVYFLFFGLFFYFYLFKLGENITKLTFLEMKNNTVL